MALFYRGIFRKSHNYEEGPDYAIMRAVPPGEKKRADGRREYMPKNQRESLIYTVLMCFVMVLWMSMYNVALQFGGMSPAVLQAGWLGFPVAYAFAMCCDWFLVSRLAKGFAFRFLVKPQDTPLKKVLCVSCCMVVPMVLIMSLYGACEGAVHTGLWSAVPLNWLKNIPRNFIMALPFQLLIAGPLVRKLFRTAFPEGTVLSEPA